MGVLGGTTPVAGNLYIKYRGESRDDHVGDTLAGDGLAETTRAALWELRGHYIGGENVLYTKATWGDHLWGLNLQLLGITRAGDPMSRCSFTL